MGGGRGHVCLASMKVGVQLSAASCGYINGSTSALCSRKFLLLALRKLLILLPLLARTNSSLALHFAVKYSLFPTPAAAASFISDINR